MPTFAAPFTPAKARGTGLSLHAACGAGDLGFAPSQPHGGPQAHYWPCESLNAFVLKMAAAGHCVNTAMMLGHRPYALEQLAMARAANDGGLNALAERLQAYFDATAPQGCAVVADIDGA